MGAIEAPKHIRRDRRRGRKFSSTAARCDGYLRLLTNDFEIPAELLGEIYRLRWLIELFFKMFKHLLGCRHLLSTKQNGVEIQFYCAIIACMLILLHTGRRCVSNRWAQNFGL